MDLQLFVLEVILGFLLQCVATMVGIAALAGERYSAKKLLICGLIVTLFTFMVRKLFNNLNFGIHTMLVILLENVLCILVLKMSIKHSVTGSLLMTVFTLLCEVLDMGIMLLWHRFDGDLVKVKLRDPVIKAAAAVPGNALLAIVMGLVYWLRCLKKKAPKETKAE